jgi:hypothetical protein
LSRGNAEERIRPVARKRGSRTQKLLVYGSLYRDQAESFEFAETQIDECIAKAEIPLERSNLIFDILATPAQIASGLARDQG